MSDIQYKIVANVSDVPDKRPLCINIDGLSIAICRVKDSFHAVLNKCTHAESTFDEGRLRGYRLMCPLHGAMFDVRTGEPNGKLAKRPLRTFEVRITPNNEIELAMPSTASNI